MKIETAMLACQIGWYILENGMLTDIECQKTEEAAVQAAQHRYPGCKIVTSEMPEHYSNN